MLEERQLLLIFVNAAQHNQCAKSISWKPREPETSVGVEVNNIPLEHMAFVEMSGLLLNYDHMRIFWLISPVCADNNIYSHTDVLKKA